MFIKLYYLDPTMQILQSNELLFGLANFLKTPTVNAIMDIRISNVLFRVRIIQNGFYTHRNVCDLRQRKHNSSFEFLQN